MTKRAWGLLFLALVTAGLLSLFASANPDGLERVLDDSGVVSNSVVDFTAPLPDYALPGVEASAVSGSLAGVIGLLVTLGMAWGAFWLLTKPRGRQNAKP